MDPEWEIYLFIGMFQFSFVFTIFLPPALKALDFLHGMMFFFPFCLFVCCFNIQAPYFNFSLCSYFLGTIYMFFPLQTVEITEEWELFLVFK